MITRYAAINLSLLPAPEAIETISHELILQDMKATFLVSYDGYRQYNPDLPAIDTLHLETEPLNIGYQVMAGREKLVRQVGNDKYKASTLAYATGRNLDVKVAELGVVRKMLDVGDPNATPPLPAVYESDKELRFRAQLAWEGQSVAGSYGAYTFHGLSAHADVLDVAIFGPETGYVLPGEVLVVILSREPGGTASPALLQAVEQHLSADDVRPLCDHVFVESANIHFYTIVAKIYVRSGSSAEAVRQAGEDAAQLYADQQYRIGADIRRGRIDAALYVGDDSGDTPVVNTEITSPAADIIADARSAPKCTAITITVEVV